MQLVISMQQPKDQKQSVWPQNQKEEKLKWQKHWWKQGKDKEKAEHELEKN